MVLAQPLSCRILFHKTVNQKKISCEDLILETKKLRVFVAENAYTYIADILENCDINSVIIKPTIWLFNTKWWLMS